MLVRHILGDDATPIAARAGEMLFRPQKIAVLEDGAVMAADAATVELFATTAGFGSLGELLQKNRAPTRAVDLDVLDADNAQAYWDRDERHDFSVSLNRGRPALDALAGCWRAGSAISSAWASRSGTSARSTTSIGSGTWDSTPRRAPCSTTCTTTSRSTRRAWRASCACSGSTSPIPADMRPQIAGRPVYLALAMNADNVLRIKPQNLLLNLPLARPQ